MKFRKTTIFATMIVAALSLGMATVSCSDDDDQKTEITLSQLPTSTRSFLQTYFPGDDVVKISLEKDNKMDHYNVKLASGVDLEFDMTGTWSEVDMPDGKVIPAGIVPAPITDYVEANYAGVGVNEISVETHGYDVELVNGVDLAFDAQGNFLRII